MTTATSNQAGAASRLRPAKRCQPGSVVQLPRSRWTAAPCTASASARRRARPAHRRAPTTSQPVANPSATSGAPAIRPTSATSALRRGRIRAPGDGRREVDERGGDDDGHEPEHVEPGVGRLERSPRARRPATSRRAWPWRAATPVATWASATRIGEVDEAQPDAERRPERQEGRRREGDEPGEVGDAAGRRDGSTRRRSCRRRRGGSRRRSGRPQRSGGPAGPARPRQRRREERQDGGDRRAGRTGQGEVQRAARAVPPSADPTALRPASPSRAAATSTPPKVIRRSVRAAPMAAPPAGGREDRQCRCAPAPAPRHRPRSRRLRRRPDRRAAARDPPAAS